MAWVCKVIDPDFHNQGFHNKNTSAVSALRPSAQKKKPLEIPGVPCLKLPTQGVGFFKPSGKTGIKVIRGSND